MRVAIVRRAPNTSISMDVYADGLVSGLKTVRPDWDIVELRPQTSSAGRGIAQKLGKYFEQYWHYPKTIKRHQADIFHIIDHSDGHLARWLAQWSTVVKWPDRFHIPKSLEGKICRKLTLTYWTFKKS